MNLRRREPGAQGTQTDLAFSEAQLVRIKKSKHCDAVRKAIKRLCPCCYHVVNCVYGLLYRDVRFRPDTIDAGPIPSGAALRS